VPLLFLGFPNLSSEFDGWVSKPLFGVVVLLLMQWAHFPHIHFGLMPDHHGLRKTSLLPQVTIQPNISRKIYL
jgi:hypothetical protein